MTLENAQVHMLVRDMLNSPTERDRQSLVGASEIGNPCDYCLGRRLLNMERPKQRYWMGARIGTAIHEALEKVAERHNQVAKSYHFKALEGALIEKKILLGYVPGYGTLYSKPDLVLTKESHLLDYKGTTKEKIKHYKLDGVSTQYKVQQNLYAWGLNKAGIKIERISLVFIPRDGSVDQDIFVYSFDYDEDMALRAWERLSLIWEYLEAGSDVETLKSHADCYVCNQIYHRF